MMMSDVFGLSAFGLGDSCTGGREIRSFTFLPASVILPSSWRGVFLAGETAAASRLETGLMWPPEAGISQETKLRRVPVGLLWSKLVRDGDRTSYWIPGSGNRCSTSAALHAHFSDLLEQAGWRGEDVVVAIPNSLDEMGQEDLLRAFGNDRERVQLIWRPVAAAMMWLHALGPDFRISAGDWMLVIYMGPDMFEVTAFTLQHDEETGYPMPVRSRSRRRTGLTGMDWAWSCCAGSSEGEKWQQILRFPEVWEALTRRSISAGSQQIWSRSDGSWDLWAPERDLQPWQSVKAQASTWISSQLERKRVQDFPSWDAFFQAMLREEAKLNERRGRLRGVVMCGSLIPQKRPGWLNVRSCAGHMQISRKPVPDSIWLPERADADMVARGAKLYGERLRAGLPTYLDTLPMLQIMTQDRRKHLVWKDLVNASTCKGGQEYSNTLHGFSYLKRHSSLTAFLQKESEDDLKSVHTYRKEEVPLPFVPQKDIPIDIFVRMKPASGLAQVRLVTCDHSVEELLFDFSRMQEVSELPKEELFCPDDGHISLADVLPEDEREQFFRDCQNFIRAPGSMHTLETYYDKVRKRLMPSRQWKIIDENGKTQPEFNKLFDLVAEQLVIIYHNDGLPFHRLARQASFLWGRTPDIFRKELAGRLSTASGKIDKGIIEAAGRCFQTKQECRLLLSHIVRMDLRYAYALTAAFHILHYRPEAVNALDDESAYRLLKIALDMMEEQRADKKVKFRNAASLIFVLLKYRLQSGHMHFLSAEDQKAKRLRVREKLEDYVREINEVLEKRLTRMAAQTRKNLKVSGEYIKDILLYIDYRGNPSAVPLMDDDE